VEPCAISFGVTIRILSCSARPVRLQNERRAVAISALLSRALKAENELARSAATNQ
jgi:hypothetical protein